MQHRWRARELRKPRETFFIFTDRQLPLIYQTDRLLPQIVITKHCCPVRTSRKGNGYLKTVTLHVRALLRNLHQLSLQRTLTCWAITDVFVHATFQNKLGANGWDSQMLTFTVVLLHVFHSTYLIKVRVLYLHSWFCLACCLFVVVWYVGTKKSILRAVEKI